MSLIPAHNHHPIVDVPRAARYAAALVLVILAAMTLASIAGRSGGNPRPLAPQGVRAHLSRRPPALCDVSEQGRFVFIADRLSTAERSAGCVRRGPSCSRSGRADRVAVGLACRPRPRLAAGI
jgi:hypothetical protein